MKLEDKDPFFDSEEQEDLEILESIKKAHEQYKRLLTNNVFVYLYMLEKLDEPSPRGSVRRVKAFLSRDSSDQTGKNF